MYMLMTGPCTIHLEHAKNDVYLEQFSDHSIMD